MHLQTPTATCDLCLHSGPAADFDAGWDGRELVIWCRDSRACQSRLDAEQERMGYPRSPILDKEIPF